MIDPFPCHIIYSHMQIIAYLSTQLIKLRGNVFCCECEYKIWILKVFLKNLKT